MQPYFFPYIGYFQLIKSCDIFVVYDDVNYIKNGWINRNKIIINGVPHWITLQVKNVSVHKKIIETFFPEENNKSKMLKSIELAYKRSKFFHEIMPIIEDIILNSDNNVGSYLTYSLKKICEYLDIRTKFINSSSMTIDNSLRNKERVIYIVKKLGGNHYINLPGGKSLYIDSFFEQNQIELSFIKAYNQGQNHRNLIMNLSIIDDLMRTPRKKIIENISNYKLE